jgi:hypothetical protein
LSVCLNDIVVCCAVTFADSAFKKH